MTPEALREMLILEPLKEFNTAEFFIALQFALLVYYPAVALGILWQDEMQQEQQCGDHYMDQLQQQQSQFMRSIQSMMRDVITQSRSIERMKRETKKAISMNGDDQGSRPRNERRGRTSEIGEFGVRHLKENNRKEDREYESKGMMARHPVPELTTNVVCAGC